MSNTPDLLDRTRKALERAIEKHGTDSSLARMWRDCLEELERPVSAQETYLSAADQPRE